MHPKKHFEDQQHVEKCKIHTLLEGMASTELEFIFSEGEQQGAQMEFTIQQVWEEDKLIQHESCSMQEFSARSNEKQ